MSSPAWTGFDAKVAELGCGARRDNRPADLDGPRVPAARPDRVTGGFPVILVRGDDQDCQGQRWRGRGLEIALVFGGIATAGHAAGSGGWLRWCWTVGTRPWPYGPTTSRVPSLRPDVPDPALLHRPDGLRAGEEFAILIGLNPGQRRSLEGWYDEQRRIAGK